MTDPDLTPDEAQALRARLRALPESIEPARDLWPAIRERVDASRVRSMPLPARHARPTRRELAPRPSWRSIAVAAVVLVISSVSLTWLALAPDGRVVEVTTTGPVPQAPAEAALASFTSYERSAADLAMTLERRAARLDPATRAVLERSLRTIDEALAEARAALAAEPASPAFQSFVEAAYRQKLDFLRRANDVAALQGA